MKVANLDIFTKDEFETKMQRPITSMQFYNFLTDRFGQHTLAGIGGDFSDNDIAQIKAFGKKIQKYKPFENRKLAILAVTCLSDQDYRANNYCKLTNGIIASPCAAVNAFAFNYKKQQYEANPCGWFAVNEYKCFGDCAKNAMKDFVGRFDNDTKYRSLFLAGFKVRG